MKKLLLLCVSLALASVMFAQVPASFKYQAIARDGSGAVLSNKRVSFRINIHQGNMTGPITFAERHYTSTNEFGLVNLEIGKGTADVGSILSINWASGDCFIQVEMDPTGGESFQTLGTSQLLSVPYALHAKTVETGDLWGTQTVSADASLEGNGTSVNPLKIAQRGAVIGNVLKWDGTTWLPSVDSTGNPLWSQSGTDVYYNGGKVGIGRIPGGDTRQFQSVTGNNQAIAANNHSATWPALYAENFGGGLAAEFRSPIKILDGTQGEGKVLTSNSTGIAAWISPPSPIWLINYPYAYYNLGNVGIGTAYPDSKLTLNGGDGSADIHLMNTLTGTAESDGVRWGTHGDGVYMWNYENTDMTFATGNEVRMRVKGNGNLELSENLWLPQGKKIGVGIYAPTNALELYSGSSTYAKFYHTSSGTDFNDGFLVGTMEYGNNAYLWNYENGPMIFGVNNSTQMVLGSTGNLSVGGMMPNYKLDVAGIANLNSGITSGAALLVNTKEALWYNGTYFSWGFDGSYNYFGRGVCIGTTADPGANYLVVNGPVAKPGGGAWSTWSDSRLKDLHGDYQKGLDAINALQPVNFSYKKGNPCNLPSDQNYVGFVAQDVQKVFPEAVTVGKDGYLNFDMHPVNVALVNAVKELKAENDRLKAENERLKADQSQINARLGKIENYLKAEAKK
jgi:hypothetical protein